MRLELVDRKLMDDNCKQERNECTLCGLPLVKDEWTRRHCQVCGECERVHKDCALREWLT